jgi:hypothetical protein
MTCLPIRTAGSDADFLHRRLQVMWSNRVSDRCRLTTVAARGLTTRLVPIVQHDGGNYAALFNSITHLSARLLRHPVGSIARYRDDLTRALDWLFFGI